MMVVMMKVIKVCESSGPGFCRCFGSGAVRFCSAGLVAGWLVVGGSGSLRDNRRLPRRGRWSVWL